MFAVEPSNASCSLCVAADVSRWTTVEPRPTPPTHVGGHVLGRSFADGTWRSSNRAPVIFGVEFPDRDEETRIQRQWLTEAKRRRDEVRRGEVQPVPGDEALAQVRRLVGR